MKIILQEDGGCAETEVTIRCRAADSRIMELLATLRVFDQKLTGEREGQTYLLAAADILYADCADRRTVLYTGAGV